MKTYLDYFEHSSKFYIAICNNGLPQIFPMSFIQTIGGKLYIAPDKDSLLESQLKTNPNIAITTESIDCKWVTISGKVTFDDFEPIKMILSNSNPEYFKNREISPCYIDDFDVKLFSAFDGEIDFPEEDENPEELA